jgi:hypothetical protein
LQDGPDSPGRVGLTAFGPQSSGQPPSAASKFVKETSLIVPFTFIAASFLLSLNETKIPTF